MMPYYIKNGITPPVRPYFVRKHRHYTPLGWVEQYAGTGITKNCVAASVGGSLLNPALYWGYRTATESLAINIATRKFYEFADALDIHLGVSLGEAPKTFSMIASTMTKIYHAYKSFRHLDVRGGLAALGMPTGGRHARSLHRKANNVRRSGGDAFTFMGDTWLEVKYGWKPLIQDVQNAAEALSKDFSKDYDVRIRTKGSAEYSLYEPLFGSSSGRGTAKAYIGAKFLIFEPELRVRSALGLTDVASIAWELMPWSFVIDWFSPIGDFIAAGHALEGLQFVDGYETTVTNIDYRVQQDRIYGIYECNLQEHLQLFKLNRNKLVGPPPISRILSSKDFSKLINLDKCVTSLALLQSVLR
jgi:hypothetical protein